MTPKLRSSRIHGSFYSLTLTKKDKNNMFLHNNITVLFSLYRSLIIIRESMFFLVRFFCLFCHMNSDCYKIILRITFFLQISL